jgi:acyl carrier protein phosphodiesterase
VNFLAHLWLADQTKTSFAGAILGDIARGADLSAYPQEIARGIRLHRKVDAATDRHPLIVATRERFAQGRRRYAGIVLDLVCDYVLATDWSRYSDANLQEFCARASSDIAEAAPWFLHAGGRATEAASFTRLLLSYTEPVGIDHALRRIAQRMRQPEPLLEASQDWNAHVATLRVALPQVLEDLKQIEIDAAVN